MSPAKDALRMLNVYPLKKRPEYLKSPFSWSLNRVSGNKNKETGHKKKLYKLFSNSIFRTIKTVPFSLRKSKFRHLTYLNY